MRRTFLMLTCVALVACGAYATPISYISATTVPTHFSTTGGDHEKGILTLNAVRPLAVYYGETKVVVDDVSFYLTAHFLADLSTDGAVMGTFDGGDVLLKDSLDNDLLVGQTQTFLITEFDDDVGVLTATGSFTVTGGSLASDFGPTGLIYDLVFEVEPHVLTDLSQPFDGLSDISLTPGAVVPEPATIAFFGIGLAGLLIRRKARAAKN